MTYTHLQLSVYAWFALVGAAAVLGLTACGGVPKPVRVGVEHLGDGINVADEAVAAEIARRGPEVHAQLRREVAEGAITDVEQGLARFEELMAPTTAARTALRAARAAAFTLERALDAWDAGSGPEATFLGAAACAVSALTRLGAVLEAAGVELPAELTDALAFLAGLAASACPAPAESE